MPKNVSTPVAKVFSDLREVFSHRNVLVLSLAGFFGYLGLAGVSSFLSDTLSLPPFYLDAVSIGIILSFWGVVVIFFAPLSGHLIDRWGRGNVAYLGVFVSLCALVLLFFSQDFWWFILSMSLFGIGGNLFWLPLGMLSVELVPQMRGATASVYNSLGMFGYTLAPYLLTPVYNDYGTSMVSGFQIIILIAMFTLLLMVFFMGYLGRQELPEIQIKKPKPTLIH